MPNLVDMKWRVDVAISTSELQRAMKPAVLIQMTLSDGAIETFEVCCVARTDTITAPLECAAHADTITDSLERNVLPTGTHTYTRARTHLPTTPTE